MLGNTHEPAHLNAAGGKAEPGVRKQLSGRRTPNKSNCKNPGLREALHSEMSKFKAKQNIKLRPPAFAVYLWSYCLLSVMGGAMEGFWDLQMLSHGKRVNTVELCV